ncbi:hypothetical protein FQN60_010522 [Etheostoma spectabile]|uniref:Uncharacterized protein n=1 Tax=Etheostoma spectabile TaxID=54343 RepID=A0A5J5CBM3_9PERO|nr:hypothetical protein FQN60_018740 [Etheostoma spectabile]KAA8589177.1 hypothetical protein FQN60_010522 [Etheostoma spectabile]
MRNIAFMQELCCLFALVCGSLCCSGVTTRQLQDQRGPTRFSHKLLDWLEDAFQLAAKDNVEDKQQNPMV